MQSDSSRQQHRKRSFSSGNFRKRDRQDLICVVCHASAIGKEIFIRSHRLSIGVFD